MNGIFGCVAMWLCGYPELCAHPPFGGRLLMSRSHVGIHGDFWDLHRKSWTKPGLGSHGGLGVRFKQQLKNGKCNKLCTFFLSMFH